MNKIKPQRIDWGSPTRPQKHSETTPAGKIAAAIIVASVILIGGWIGYQEYKEWKAEQQAIQLLNQFAKETQALTEQANRDVARYKAEQEEKALQRKLSTERGIDEIREQHIAKAKAEQKNMECRYWKEKLAQLETQGNKSMVKRWCD